MRAALAAKRTAAVKTGCFLQKDLLLRPVSYIIELLKNYNKEDVDMLVSAKEMLTKAKAGKYAVGQFNINNLEWTKAILLTAQKSDRSHVVL